MATTVKEGNFIYRINPDKPTDSHLQRKKSSSLKCGQAHGGAIALSHR